MTMSKLVTYLLLASVEQWCRRALLSFAPNGSMRDVRWSFLNSGFGPTTQRLEEPDEPKLTTGPANP